MLTVSVADESQLEWVSIFVVFVEVGSSTRQLVVILECVNGRQAAGIHLLPKCGMRSPFAMAPLLMDSTLEL